MAVDPRTGEIIREQPQQQTQTQPQTQRHNRPFGLTPFDRDRMWDFLCSPIIVFWITLGIVVFVFGYSDDIWGFKEEPIIKFFGEGYVESANLSLEELHKEWAFSLLVALVSFGVYLISVIKFAVSRRLVNPLTVNRSFLTTLIEARSLWFWFFWLVILIIDFRFLFFFFANWINNGDSGIWLRWGISLLPVIISLCLVLEAFGIISRLYRLLT
ncbi:MAG: hypothetical protein LBQ66_12640 [Planctomycetaceae bacterium]|jgi:hypothetical protein|nr:hypothetical protein [Planctomycetaceae bacterium]